MRKPLFFLLLLVTSSLWAQHEKTSVQSLSEWKPTFDVRSDVVMVYGANDRPTQTFRERVQTWRDHGYITHFMSGIAWGPYWDYFSGQWDGTPRMDEAQVTAEKGGSWCGKPFVMGRGQPHAPLGVCEPPRRRPSNLGMVKMA